MELLCPSPPPQPIGDYFAGIVLSTQSSSSSSVMDFNLKFDPRNFMAAAAAAAAASASSSDSRLPGGEEVCEKVYVAVGKSIERTVSLLHWTFRQFRNREVCLLHVHQPSATIPTLLGKLPVTQAKEELVTAYREEERERSRKLLFNYLGICFRAKVAARIITIESGQVHKGIVELVNTHGIRNLVMGAVPDNWMKVKKNTSKADYAAKNSPPFCEIWFVNKGKHIWSREATEDMSFPPMLSPPKASLADQLRSELSPNQKREFLLFEPSSPNLGPYATGRFCDEGGNCQMDPDRLDLAFASGSSYMNRASSFLNPISSNTASGYTSAEIMAFSGSSSNTDEEILFKKLIEVSREAEKAKDEAFAELLERKRLESQAVETMNKVQAFETAHTREVQLRRKVEDALNAIKQEKEKLMEETGEVSGDIERTMKNVAVLGSRVQEATHRQEAAATEWRHIQASLANLRREKQKIQRQKEELTRRLEQWKSHGEVGELNFDGLGLGSDSEDFTDFSLSDLQAATCNFSESFKIGQGPYGCVYKGEMLDKSVAIKKFHSNDIQGRLEFQTEVQVLSKLQHPHLVTVIGACPEALLLVCEYLPNGSIQDHLFRKTNNHPLNWKTRTRITAAISSALLFLHSSEPERIIHGDLKSENVLLDSDFNCKIGDFAIHRLVPEDNARCPSFGLGTVPSSALPYKDPELRTDGEVTPKSDIYSFGVIILQILTGRPPAGLASEVRRAVLSGRLVSLLDPLAGEWPTFIARRLVELGLQCCEMNPRDRPELTPTLVRELEQLHLAEERQAPSFFLCPILREIMHAPHVAADGFTYEGEAIRGWLQNGRETSPMTNLKLSHLHLTPNHALQLAIRDWLCQS